MMMRLHLMIQMLKISQRTIAKLTKTGIFMADNTNPNTNTQSGNTSPMEGCSAFFLTSSALSLINGKKNRTIALEHARQDEQFAKVLLQQKELYEDQKEVEEHAFKIWLKNSQRKFARRMTERRLSNDLALADLRMFFSDWPLQISVEALNEKRQNETQAKPMCFVIGKAYAGDSKDAFSLLYSEIVDNVTTLLRDMGAKDNCVYRFKDKPNVVGGPALANIYAMMNTFPTVVIMPTINQKNKVISLSVGCWTPDSLFPFQKRVLSMEYDPLRIVNDKEHLIDFKEKYSYACFAVAAVLNDTYNLSEGYNTCLFPQFASKHSLFKKYPDIANFAIREYTSYIDTKNDVIEENGKTVNVWNEISGEEEQKKVRCLVSKSVNLIKT